MAKLHDHQKAKAAAAAKAMEFDKADAAGPPPQDAPPPRILPPFVWFDDLITKPVEEPPMLIKGPNPAMPREGGLIHVGDKVLLGSDSKAGKTWYLLQKALCISAGIPFLGHETTGGNVLYINFELRPWAFHRRVQMVAKALGLIEQDGMGRGKLKTDKIPNFIGWNLRGESYDIEEICACAEERFSKIPGLKIAAIAIDPLYKSYGEADENSASDMGAVLKRVELFAQKFNAALFIAAHFAKGDAASKNQLDRMSGSGVLSRDPDGIFTLTRIKNEEEDAARHYLWEATLRNMKSPEPKVVTLDWPIWKIVEGVTAKTAACKPIDADALLASLPPEGLSTNAWLNALREDGKEWRKGRFLEAVDGLVKAGKLAVLDGPRGAKIYTKNIPK
jgi:hypothetical protein